MSGAPLCTARSFEVSGLELPNQMSVAISSPPGAGPVLVGMLIIKNFQLVAEVNSYERGEEIQEIIAQRLGEKARYKMTSISPLEGEVEKLWEEAMNSPAAKRSMSHGSNDSELPYDFASPFSSVRESFDPDSPEVQAILKETAAQHWSTWFDLPVPALDNMTPREASISPEGRDLLESLLLYYEIETSRIPNNAAAPDIPYLRRELGMD